MLDPRGLWAVQITKTQEVEQRAWARALRNDIAQDAADAGCRTLVGLDGAGVIVAFDLEGDRPAFAHIDHAGMAARTGQHTAPFLGQRGQHVPRRLVGAVLAPHASKHR